MKIFKFDPNTGRKGELLQADAVRPSWTGCSIHYLARMHAYLLGKQLVEEINAVRLPVKKGETWTAHVEAGSCFRGKFTCMHTDEWICMCTGEWNGGVGWNWIVLPPKEFAEKILKSIPEEIGEEA